MSLSILFLLLNSVSTYTLYGYLPTVNCLKLPQSMFLVARRGGQTLYDAEENEADSTAHVEWTK